MGRVINKFKVAKHFKLFIEDDAFTFTLRQDKIDAEAALDGIYIVRTSLPAEVVSAEDTVRHYKSLGQVEKCFRAMKTMDLHVRPIYHYSEDRVRAHIFLCMLAYYVEWHLISVWKPLLFAHEVDTLPSRDPVDPARPAEHDALKASRKLTADGNQVHSFTSLIPALGSVVRNTCRSTALENGSTFEMTTRPDSTQEKALELVKGL